ncbi:MAG TPA: C25 family cysteine peptidase [Planctomycetota bacterium]|nr:C25 family cysteine peptidase [Planctomycetota bacterium]
MIGAAALVLALQGGSIEAGRLLVVAPGGFRDALEPLLAHRRAERFRVEFVAAEEGTGQEGKSIAAFLRGRLSGGEAPTHILLVGDAALLPAEVLEEDGARTASDERWVPEGRRRPAIGRLPARDVGEAGRLVERILRYERGEARGPWRARVLLTAGEGGFGSAADRAIEAGARLAAGAALPEGFELRVVRLSAGADPGERELRESLTRALEPGALLWVYAGHGNARSLASGVGSGFLPSPPERTVRSLRLSDARALRCGGHAPVAILLACETALLRPGAECLAEALVRSADGPVAVLGAGAVSHPLGDLALALEVGRALRGDREARLGEIVGRAREALLRDSTDRGFLERGGLLFGIGEESRRQILRRTALQYLLLGDPALRLPRPSPVRVEVDRGEEQVVVRGAVEGEGEGFARVEVERAPGARRDEEGVLARAAVEFSGASFRVPLDSRRLEGPLRVRAFVRRGNREWAGEARVPLRGEGSPAGSER